MKRNILVFSILIICINSLLIADVKLPAIIGNNMALQQKTDACIWGWADSNETVSIKSTWQSSTIKTKADSNGKWKTKIKTPQAGGPHTLTIKGNNTIEIKNIIIGEVWLCSGQSNMEMPMKGYNNQPVANSSEEIASSSNKSIRLFKVARNISDVPVEDTKGSWVECTPDTVKDFSATGYYFGRKINKETQYPVGLICSSWGGTLAQAWTRLDFIKYDDNLNPVIGYYNTNLEKWKKHVLKLDQKNHVVELGYGLMMSPEFFITE